MAEMNREEKVEQFLKMVEKSDNIVFSGFGTIPVS